MIKGFIKNKQFKHIYNVFERNYIENQEIGSSFILYYKGEQVVKLNGGYSDNKNKTEFNENTLVNVYSVSKFVTNLCVLYLIENNLIDFNDKICLYWPEFSTNGKENITIEQLLSHQAGLVTLDEPIYQSDIEEHLREIQEKKLSNSEDLNTSFSNRLAEQKPHWNLNKFQAGYHPFMVGFYVAEIVRRVDSLHRTLTELFTQDILPKLNLPHSNNDNNDNPIEFYFAFPKNDPDFDLNRIARLYSVDTATPLPPLHPNSNKFESFLESQKEPKRTYLSVRAFFSFQYSSTRQFSPFKARFLEIPSAVGYTTSNSLSKIFQSIVENYINPKDDYLFSKETLDKAFSVSYNGHDCILNERRTYSKAGFILEPIYPNSFCHSGSGGSLGFGSIEKDKEFSFAYIPNALQKKTNFNKYRLLDAVYYCINQLSDDYQLDNDTIYITKNLQSDQNNNNNIISNL